MSSAVPHNRRRTPRIPLEVPAQFMLQQSAPILVKTVDASIGGVCIVTSQSVAPGSPCMIAFDLMTQEGQRRINAWGVIVDVRQQGDSRYHCRIAFTDMDTRSRYFMRQFTNDGE
ncbi:PilZ domain-containing protein [Noviherbaspirillum aerium]|uniref:PilZ domain-containing protein n=1 Tax=Noviherbaspirillum aerium TaxID=2588497 RepID=UPI00124F5F70|nr:PilZ domain-containing protein [Noviherbaspirillum aerium]